MELGLGNIEGSAFGRRGVTKRLEAMASVADLRGHRLLDIGCATGTYTIELAKGFDTTDAIDVEPERLTLFRERLHEARIHISQMSAESMSYSDGTFDVVTAIETLEHVRDLDRTFEEIHRVLNPGGLLVVTGPNRYFPFETHGWLWHGNRRSPTSFPFLPWLRPLHRRLADARSLTVHSLTKRARRHGFERTGHTYLMPPFDRQMQSLRFLDGLERTPLRFFGLTLVVAFKRWERASSQSSGSRSKPSLTQAASS